MTYPDKKEERQKNSFRRLLDALEDEVTSPMPSTERIGKLVGNLRDLEQKLYPQEQSTIVKE